MYRITTTYLLRPIPRQRPPVLSTCRASSGSALRPARANTNRARDKPEPPTHVHSGLTWGSRQGAPVRPAPSHKPAPFVTKGPQKSEDGIDTKESARWQVGSSISPRSTRQQGERTQTPGARLRAASARGNLWQEKRISTEELRAWLETQVEEQEDVVSVAEKEPVVLIMFNASKSLTESDFHRLVRQNPHLEGWNSQLEKVAQAYDRTTLEPLGCYFLHFTSTSAARTFQLEAQRLHFHKPVGSSDLASAPSPSFSASPETPLRLRLYTLQPPTVNRLHAFTLDGILGTPATVSAKRAPSGATTDPSTHRAPREHHSVVLSLDHGAMELSTLQKILRRDGHSRNLAWDVTQILPYHPGKVAPTRRKSREPAWKSWKSGRMLRDDAAPRPVLDEAEGAADNTSAPTVLPEPPAGNFMSKSGRFVLSFGNEAEARRFVRMWHRREFEMSAYLPKAAALNASDARPVITVNATLPL